MDRDEELEYLRMQNKMLKKQLETYSNNNKGRIVTNKEIIDALCDGYDPFTGEVFDENHILNNTKIKSFLMEVRQKYTKYGVSSNITKHDLNKYQLGLFEILREWRAQRYVDEGFFSAYMVFNDNELINIVVAPVNQMEDLLNVSGIGKRKYELYGEDLFKIISRYKYNNEDWEKNE